MSNEEPFSLQDFKKWMSAQRQESTKRVDAIIGMRVESRINAKRLASRISSDDGDVVEIAKDFKRNGGVVLDVNEEHSLLVETESGAFVVPRCFVRTS